MGWQAIPATHDGPAEKRRPEQPRSHHCVAPRRRQQAPVQICAPPFLQRVLENMAAHYGVRLWGHSTERCVTDLHIFTSSNAAVPDLQTSMSFAPPGKFRGGKIHLQKAGSS